jgi:ankyrin repeat protein
MAAAGEATPGVATPDALATVLARTLLHGLIAVMIWKTGESIFGQVTELYGGLLPLLIFAVLALVFALWQVRDLSQQVIVTEAGLRLTGGRRERLVGVADIRALAPVSPATIAWRLLWPTMPWRLLTTPDSLQGWWRVETTDGSFFFRCEQADALKALVASSASAEQSSGSGGAMLSRQASSTPENLQPFNIVFRWQFDLALLILAVFANSLFVVLFFYGMARAGDEIWREKRRLRWRRVRARYDMPGFGLTASGASPNANPALISPSFSGRTRLGLSRGSVGFSDRLASVAWMILLLPLRLPSLLAGGASSVKRKPAWIGRLLLAVIAWFFLSVPQKIWQALVYVVRISFRALVLFLHGIAWLSLRALPQAWQLMTLAGSLWQTILLTTVGWALAVICSYPLSMLLADLSAAVRREPGTMRKEASAGQVSLETRDWQGRTLLMVALDRAAGGGTDRNERLLVARSLLQRGADVTAVDHAGRSTAYLAVQAGLSGTGLRPYLGAANAQRPSALGATLVHAAAASGDTATMEDVLQSGAGPAIRTADGRTAMHFARGRAMVLALFQRGLDADALDARGRLPLHAAIIAGDADAARALANITLAPQTADIFGRQPLDYAPAAGRQTGSASKPLTGAERTWNELAREIGERTRK